MVLFYECQHDSAYVVYVGLDKFENEKLLQNGFPEDVWFHVDKYSSAHVYLRIPLVKWRSLMEEKFPPNGLMPKGGLGTLLEEDYRTVIPREVVEEMSTLVKGNSIEGSKRSEVDIVWTPFANLRKDQQTMETGTVGFHNDKQCFYVKDAPRNKDLLKKIERSKISREVDLGAGLEGRQKEEMTYKKMKTTNAKAAEKAEEKRRVAEKEAQSYDNLHFRMADVAQTNDLGPEYKGTIDECRDMEDDFM